MLQGAFPFDPEYTREDDSDSAFRKVLYEQVRQKWYENPHNSAATEVLSPECLDLFNRVFTIDEGSRITIPGIKAHPWYTRPLVEPYASAAERLAQRQREVEGQKLAVPVRP